MAQQLTQLCEGLGPELARQAMYWCRSVHWTSQAFQVKVACTANSSHIPDFCPTPYNQSHCTTFLQDGAVPCWPLVLRDTYDASPLKCIQPSCLSPQAGMSSCSLLGPSLLCRTAELVPCSVPMQISTEAVLRAHSAPQHPQLQRKSLVHCRTAVVPCSVKVLCDGLAVLAAYSVPQHCPQYRECSLCPAGHNHALLSRVLCSGLAVLASHSGPQP